MYLKSEVIVHQYTVTPDLEYTMNRNDTHHGVLGWRIIGWLNRRCQGDKDAQSNVCAKRTERTNHSRREINVSFALRPAPVGLTLRVPVRESGMAARMIGGRAAHRCAERRFASAGREGSTEGDEFE